MRVCGSLLAVACGLCVRGSQAVQATLHGTVSALSSTLACIGICLKKHVYSEDMQKAYVQHLGIVLKGQNKALKSTAQALCFGFSMILGRILCTTTHALCVHFTLVDTRFSCLEHTPTGRHMAVSFSARLQTPISQIMQIMLWSQ